jgi:hypothetical protein
MTILMDPDYQNKLVSVYLFMFCTGIYLFGEEDLLDLFSLEKLVAEDLLSWSTLSLDLCWLDKFPELVLLRKLIMKHSVVIPDPIITTTTKGERGKNFQLVNGTGTGTWD